MAKRVVRVAVDAGRLDVDLDSEELREILNIAPDIWEDMPNSQKLLLLSKRGLAAARAALRGELDDDE
jgi:hypothetical protein